MADRAGLVQARLLIAAVSKSNIRTLALIVFLFYDDMSGGLGGKGFQGDDTYLATTQTFKECSTLHEHGPPRTKRS